MEHDKLWIECYPTQMAKQRKFNVQSGLDQSL